MARTDFHRGHGRGRPGQAIVLVALALVVLCGMAAVGVDVGMATSKQHLLRNAASNAALDARQLLADHESAATTTNTMVWNSLTASLVNAGLTVRNATGAGAPTDACAAGYSGSQVALTAFYLNGQNTPITDPTTGSPITITATTPVTVPDGAAGVQVGLGACQLAAFGGVIGHPRYTIAVNSLAGQPSIAATNTPGPTDTAYPTDTPTITPTTTTTAVPSNTATAVPTTTATTGPTTTPTATPPSTPCTFTIPGSISSGQGFYTTFTTSDPGDIGASWTFSANSGSSAFYLGLYSGAPSPFVGGSGTAKVDPTTQKSGLTTTPPKLDLVSVGAINNSAQTETLDYTTDATALPKPGLQAPAGTYTVYFYNSNSQAATVSAVTVTYMSHSCPGSATVTPAATSTATATPPPTMTATSTATATPPPTATATPPLVPYTVSGAPDNLCTGASHPIQPEIEPPDASGTPLPGDATYQPEEYYCPGVYAISATTTISAHVALYANGVGLGNNYGHDANFKGFDGNTSLWTGLVKNSNSKTGFQNLFNDEVDRPQNTGGGNNGPSAPCPAIVRVPLISRIAHHGNFDWFAPLGMIQVTLDSPTSCGNPTTGVITGVIYDPDHIVTLPPGVTTLPYYLP